jgi:large subunit ribosomal protein L2
MPVKTFNPTSPSRRQMTVSDFSQLTDKKPEKKLLSKRSRTGGRNSYGRITVRHIGGGARRKIRLIDWKRDKDGIPARVASLNMIPTAVHTLRCWFTRMAKSAISSHQTVLR